MSRLQALTSRAVNTLEDLLDAKDHPTVRLGAARTLVEIGMHQHDAETIVRKLGEIEAAQQRQKTHMKASSLAVIRSRMER